MTPHNISYQPWFALHPQRFGLGESPRFAHGQLRWVDIEARTLHTAMAHQINLSCQPAMHFSTRDLPDQIACVLPTTDPARWIGFGRLGVWMLNDHASDEHLLDAPFDSSRIRFNDACCDEWGRIWVASLVDDKKSSEGALYCFAKGGLQEVFAGLITGNGLAYSATLKKLWLADTTARHLRSFHLDAHTTALRETGFDYRYTHLTERPDGACLLSPDSYAVAVIDGWRIDVFDTITDALKYSIHAPFNKITMPCVLPLEQPLLVVTSASSDVPVQGISPSEKNLQTGCLLAKPLSTTHCDVHVYQF